MRAIGICALGLSILLSVKPTDAQGQGSAAQLQTMPQQPNRANLPAANKARLTNRFHRLNSQYGALKPRTAKYANAKPTHPALRQYQSEIISTKREIEMLKQQVESKLDSMSEMGEMESLRLQMAMDRISKLMSILSNLLKKASETEAAIIQNIK